MNAHKYASSGRLPLRQHGANALHALRERGLRYAVRSAISIVGEGAYWGTRRKIWAVRGELLRRRTAPSFVFAGGAHRYFWHPYNATWRNERSVEVPIVRAAMADVLAGRTLEVGNVLSHYFEAKHEVVDKFERAPGVINVDVLDYEPGRDYDLIVSISTLEHVGWDDDPRDPARAGEALARIRRLLSPSGRALITVPYGYNSYLDGLVSSGGAFDSVRYLRRTGRRSWVESEHAEIAATRYGEPYPGANALVVGTLRKA